MITTLQDILQLPQKQKDGLLAMVIDRLATMHRVYPDEIRCIDRMTSGNFAHQISYIRQNLNAGEHLITDFCNQAGIDLDTLSRQDDFKFVLNIFDNAFEK